MAANTAPIFTRVPSVQWGTTVVATANTAKDGTGTQLTVFTADATNGSFVQRIRFRAAGTNIATVARLFVNNGSTNATAANNVLIAEITLPATTLSETSAQPEYEFGLNYGLDAGYKLNVAIGTTVSAGYYVAVIGGHY